eukprot:14368111-Alexandrium_andersonii.AAC.1
MRHYPWRRSRPPCRARPSQLAAAAAKGPEGPWSQRSVSGCNRIYRGCRGRPIEEAVEALGA